MKERIASMAVTTDSFSSSRDGPVIEVYLSEACLRSRPILLNFWNSSRQARRSCSLVRFSGWEVEEGADGEGLPRSVE